MQVRCVKAFGTSVPGDVAEVPDGAAVDPEHWEIAQDMPPSPPPARERGFPAPATTEGM